jgi:protease I
MGERVKGKKVAILVADGFEEAEFFEPKKALEDEGAQVEVVSLGTGDIQGFRHMEKTRTAKADRAVKDARAADYDALYIPGGLFNPDHLRADPAVIDFVQDFFEQRKPVGAICHGPQVLMTARVCQGRMMTAYKTVQPDLELAGAKVRDEAVVVDNGLVTSRCPDDIPAFNKKLIEEIAEARHRRKAA